MSVNAGDIVFTLNSAATKANLEGVKDIVKELSSGLPAIKLKFQAEGGDPVKLLSEIRNMVEEISKKSMEMNISLSSSNKSSSSSLKAYRDQITQVSSALSREFATINKASSNFYKTGKNIWGEETNSVSNLESRVRELNTEMARLYINGDLDISNIGKLSGQELIAKGEAIGNMALKIRSLYNEINAAAGKDITNIDDLFKPERAATSAESAEKIAAALAAAVTPAEQVGSAMGKVTAAGLPAEQFEAIVAPLNNINEILSNIPKAANNAKAALKGAGEAGKQAAEETAKAEAKAADAVDKAQSKKQKAASKNQKSSESEIEKEIMNADQEAEALEKIARKRAEAMSALYSADKASIDSAATDSLKEQLSMLSGLEGAVNRGALSNNEFAESFDKISSAVSTASKQVNNQKKVMDDAATAQAKQQKLDDERVKILEEARRRQTELEVLQSKYTGAGGTDTGFIEEATNKFKQLGDAIEKVSTTEATALGNQGFASQLKEYSQDYDDATKSVNKYIEAQKLLRQAQSGQNSIEKLQAEFLKAGGKKSSSEYQNMSNIRQQYIDIAHAINDAKKAGNNFSDIDLSELSAGLNKTNGEAQVASKTFERMKAEGMGFAAEFKQAFTSQLNYTFGAQAAARAVIQYTRDMVTAAIDLDSAMTQLKIVTNESDEAYQSYAGSLSKTAQEVGSSISDLTDSATVYARLGYSLDESAQLSKLTAMMQNVGNIDVSSAQNAMTAIVKAFDIGVDGVESAMDKMVAVGNNAPISVAEIAEGMNNAASALSSAGNTFDESVALLTAANTTVQNVSKSSTGLRTISARIRKMDTELNDLGETMTTADYDAMVSALTDAAVSLTDQNGQLRSTYDILSDIAAKWSELNANERAALAETLSGTRQQNVFFSIIEQFQEAQKAMELMGESEGTLNKANDKYMESVQAHINQFKAAFQGIASNTFTADFLNLFIKMGTGILNAVSAVTKLANAFGGLKTILAGIIAFNLPAIFTAIVSALGTALGALAILPATLSTLFAGLFASNPVGMALLGVVAAIAVTTAAVNTLTTSYDEQVEKVNKLTEEYEKFNDESSEYQQLLAKQKQLEKEGRKLSRDDQVRLAQLQAEKDVLEDTLKTEKELERTKWLKKMNNNSGVERYVTDESGNSYPEYLTIAQNNLSNIIGAVSSLNSQFQSGEGSVKDYYDSLGKIVSGYSDIYNEYKKYQGAEGWTAEMEAFVQYYETVLEGRQTILDAISKEDKAVGKIPVQYKHTEEAIKSATVALEKFNEASSKDNSEVVNSYAEAYKKFQSDWDAGKVGSNTVKAAIDLFIPDNIKAKFGNDTQQLGELLNTNVFKSVFSGDDASKYADNLINYVKENASQFEGILDISQDGIGYSIQYSSLSELARAFGVTTEAAAGFISMLQDYSDTAIISKQDTAALAYNLDLLEAKSQGGVSSFNDIAEAANKLAKLDPDIGASGIISTLQVLEQAGYIDLSGVQNQLGLIVESAIAARNAEVEAGEEAPDIEISTNSSEAIAALQGVVNKLAEIQSKSIDVTVNYHENGSISDIVIGGNSAGGTRNAPGGKTLVNELGPELIAENGRAYIAGGGQPTVVDLSPGAIVLTANETKKALKSNRRTSTINSAAAGVPGLPLMSGSDVLKYLTDPIVDAISSAQTAKPKDGMKLPKGSSTTDDYLAYLAAKDSARNPAPKPSSTSTGGSGNWYGSGGGGGEDPNKRKKGWFEEELKEHKHLVEMEQETQEDYLKWLDEAYKLAYEDKEFELDDYRKYEEEVYKGLQDLFKDYISDREFEIEALERVGDKAEEISAIYQKLITEIEAKIQEAYDYGLTDNDDYVQTLYKELWGFKDKVSDLEEDSLDDSQKATEKLIKYRMKMIKKELEDEKKSYEERLKTLNEFIDKQKQMLRDDAAQEDYLDEQAEKRKKVTNLQLQLNALEFDDSAKAQKKKLQLQEQLADAQKELDKFERDHAIDVAEEELDHIAELAEESTKKQTDAIDEQLDNQQYLYERALQDIINNNRTLYEDMIAYEKRYGEGHEAPVVQMWEEAYIALKNYAGLYGELYKGIDLQNLTGYNGTPTVRGYASGTRNAAAGLHRLFENGDEYVFTSSNGSTYRMFSGGEKVLNAQASNFLYDFANTRGGILSNLINGIGKSIGHITSSTNEPVNIVMGDININGSASEETVSQIRREQKAGVRYMLEELKKLKR